VNDYGDKVRGNHNKNQIKQWVSLIFKIILNSKVMQTSVKERLKKFIGFKKISVQKFEKSIGVANSFVNSIVAGIGGDKLYRIIKVYPELNIDWLLDGTGEMLKSVSDKEESTFFIPLMPVVATGGVLTEFSEGVIPDNCEHIRSPFDHADIAVPIRGDSMAPEYPNGSIVFVKRINPNAFVEWGKVYVLCTCNGNIVKEVHPANDNQHIVCRSLNPFHPVADFTVDTADIYSWWIVLGCVAAK
jgi:hypothetical protein